MGTPLLFPSCETLVTILVFFSPSPCCFSQRLFSGRESPKPPNISLPLVLLSRRTSTHSMPPSQTACVCAILSSPRLLFSFSLTSSQSPHSEPLLFMSTPGTLRKHRRVCR